MARVYVDATFDPRSKVAFIGYCNESMTRSNANRIKVSNINEAEMAALCLAIREIGLEHSFYSDSKYVVETCMWEGCQHIPRKLNLADTIVSAFKENFFSN
jgi:ribonuclease HI